MVTKTLKKTSKRLGSNKELFIASVNVFGQKYESKGSSISEAISNLKPKNVKGRIILVLKKGEKVKERILMPFVSTRLFNTMGVSREVAL